MVFLIALLASLTVPSLINSKKSQDKQAALYKLINVANNAREWAKQTGNTYTLTYDDATKTLTAAPYDSTKDPKVTTPKQKPQIASTASTSKTNDDSAPTGPTDNVILGQEFRVTKSQAGEEDTGTSTWTLKIYPDGSAESGYVEWQVDNQPVNLKVDHRGQVSLNKESASQDEDQWSAGNFEPRTSTTQ